MAANYLDAGVRTFVLAYFVRDLNALRSIRQALGVPLRVVRLAVPWPDIERRLTADVIENDRPVAVVAGQVMSWLQWP